MKNRTLFNTTVALCAAINIIGAFIAVTLKLPIYLDTIGTFLAAFLMGPYWAMFAGAATGIINGITFDPVSFYYIPVQLVIGGLAGLLFSKEWFNSKLKGVISTVLISVSGSIIASIITAFVFGGITSSGSTYIVVILKNMGMNIFTAVFSTQIFTDILDKAIAIAGVLGILKVMPREIKRKFI
ncbi:ECF transporter S component [Clostridium bovifaecis]|uniref:ECF transporter S component n=1 Tax=Clostridium bovifaecis TaxID=2184719 RepID=A0A6I6ET54_9CLOT|nr:ECF transporter S component [Clostridium bovifaecis]